MRWRPIRTSPTCASCGFERVAVKTTSNTIMKPRIAPILAAGAVLLAPFTSAAAESGSLFGDRIVAKGNGFEVKKQDVDLAVLEYKANLAASGQSVPTSQSDEVRAKIRDRIVALQVVLGMATETDRKAGLDVAEKFIKAAREESKSEAEYKRKLMTRGFTVERWEAQIRDKEVSNVVLERVLRSKMSVTDAEVKDYYDEHPEEFQKPELLRAAHILLSTMDMKTRRAVSDDEKTRKKRIAEKLLERARKGEDFGKLAKEFSEDPGSKDNGGEYVFPRGRMVPQFEAAAFALNTGEISDIVETQFGFHIIKSLERMPASKVPLAEVAENLREGLKQKKFQDALPAFLESEKKLAGVEILE